MLLFIFPLFLLVFSHHDFPNLCPGLVPEPLPTTNLTVAITLPGVTLPELRGMALFALEKFKYSVPGYTICPLLVDSACGDLIGRFNSTFYDFTNPEHQIVAVLGDACATSGVPTALLGLRFLIFSISLIFHFSFSSPFSPFFHFFLNFSFSCPASFSNSFNISNYRSFS